MENNPTQRKKSNYYSKLSSSYQSAKRNVQNWYELLSILESTHAFLASNVLYYERIKCIPLLLVSYAVL